MNSTARVGLATFASFAAFVCASSLGACTSNPYFIGAACPGASDASTPCSTGGTTGTAGANAAGAAGTAGANSALSFAVDLDQSGASHLSSQLELPGARIDAALRFRGETATVRDWPSDQGALLIKSEATPLVQREAPFTDGTRAVAFGTNTTTYIAQNGEPGDVGADDFMLELVLRAVPGAAIVAKRDARAGWAIALAADGALTLELADEQRTLRIASESLTPRAWYHCLFWVSRAAGGQAFCNGRAGTAQDSSALGSLGSPTPLTMGGGAPITSSASELADFSLFRAPAGGLGSAAAWPDISRQRFAKLTGVSPRVARGSLLPRPDVRDSPAYLDLQRGATSRLLFLVGPDWPRITCRTDAAGVRDCGYLSEPERSRALAGSPQDWSAGELSVVSDSAPFADGEQHLAGLVPSAQPAPHTLRITSAAGGARQALSFFARAEQGHFVGASVTGLDQTIFDVAQGRVVTAPPGAQASIEPWGDGLFRCVMVFEPTAGPLAYELELLGGEDAQPFAGDGQTPWLDVGGLQLDVGLANAGSLLASDIQAADQLSFVGDDGNLPSGNQMVERLRVLLPQGPRLTDQALLNLNRDGEFENQVQLYLTGDAGELKFWALRDGDTHWAFTHSAAVNDGLRHQIQSSWSESAATLTVDGDALTRDTPLGNESPFELDRIDVAYSANSSGNLEGLVAGIEIAEH